MLPNTSIDDGFEEAVYSYECLVPEGQSLFDAMYELYDSKNLSKDQVLLFTNVINRACELEVDSRHEKQKRRSDLHRHLKTEFGKFLIQGEKNDS